MVGARYEHFRDLDGWRLIFLNTGPREEAPQPMGASGRRSVVGATIAGGPDRSRIVFAHHSRLSRGRHGENRELDGLWQTLSHPHRKPIIAPKVPGHNHSISTYGPRRRETPEAKSVGFGDGTHLMANAAGRHGHATGFRGAEPDLFFDDDHFCLTRITLEGRGQRDIEVLSFEKEDPPKIEESKVSTMLPRRF